MIRNMFHVLVVAALSCAAAGAARVADRIALVVSTLNNPYFVSLADGAKAKAKELGYNLVVFDSQNDTAKELSNVEDALNQNVKALLLNPVDSAAARAAVREAEAQKVPVLTLDRSAKGVTVTSHIASDNVAGGKLAGELIVKELNGKGNVVSFKASRELMRRGIAAMASGKRWRRRPGSKSSPVSQQLRPHSRPERHGEHSPGAPQGRCRLRRR